MKQLLTIMALLFCLSFVTGVNQCDHNFVTGPFYIKAAINFEEPTYYSPSGLVHVMHCTKCGILKLPQGLESKTGTNTQQ